MSQGVLLLALGNAFYGNYAVQLARSIKAASPNTSVSVAYSGNVLSHNRELPFDHKIVVQNDYFITNGFPDYLKAKTHLYELSPYDKTIFIDADVIWCPNRPITELFEQLSEVDVTFSNKGRQKLSEARKGFIHWANPEDIAKEYGSEGWLYNVASEFIYFRKSKEVQEFFEVAQRAYLDPKIEYKKFAFHLPDELAFEIAMIHTGLYPHKEMFMPFYWEQYEKRGLKRHEIQAQYYGLSIGGNLLTEGEKQMYNELANIANSKFGISGYFDARSKMSWLIERKEL